MILDLLTLLPRLVWFTLWFIQQIFRSAGRTILHVIMPTDRSTPRVVRLHLGDIGSVHAAVTSILITITPGTVVLGVVGEDDDVTLLIHTLYYADADEAHRDLIQVDRRMMEAVRVGGADARH